MKILVIPTTDWTGHPVPNRLNFIFDRLALRHEVDVCHFKLFRDEVRQTRCNLVPMDNGFTHDVRSYYPQKFVEYARRIRRISPDYDLLLSANILPGLAASMQGSPTVVDYMDLYPESAASYFSPPMKQIVRGLASWICRVNLERASGVITTTPGFREYLRSSISTPVAVVPNGLDTGLMRPVDPRPVRKRYALDYPVLGYVGSLESWIDLEHIIDVFPTVLERYPGATLLVVGPGLHTSYAEDLKKRVDTKALTGRVIFTGRVPYHELAPYISAMDVALNPRKPWRMNTLTMGGKVLSYLACGVPVLSRNMPAVETEFGDGKGVLTYNNNGEFIEQLERAFEVDVDPSVVRNYDWDNMAIAYEKILEKFVVKG